VPTDVSTIERPLALNQSTGCITLAAAPAQ
jgi:hypothetical protein